MLSNIVRPAGMRLLAFLGLAFILGACTVSEEGAWFNAPGWRRAERVGASRIPDPVTIALDDAQNIYIFLAEEDDDGDRLLVRRFDRRLDLVWERQLEVALGRADQPRIIWDAERLRLFWLDGDQLYGATMAQNGQMDAAPQLLSGDVPVGSYDLAISQQNVSLWFGGDARRPGVFTLDPTATDPQPALIDPDGYRPQVRMDARDNLHAAWLRYPPGASRATVVYAHGASSAMPDLQTEAVTSFTVGFSSSLQGPYFGVDDGHAYLLWSVLVRTGLSAGSATTSYVAFPLGRPQEASTPQSLFVPADYDLPYTATPADSALQAGQRVMLGAGGGRATPLDFWANERPAAELVFAARASVAYQLRKQASQSTLVFFEDGAPREYQLLSFSRSNTVAPYVRSDDDGYLYATWLEPRAGGEFVAYLGATAPELHGALNDLTLNDVRRMATETIFGLLAGAALSPFAGIFWLVAPLFILGVTSFMRRDDERTISPGSALSLVLALIAYWMVKVLTLPGIGDYVPFSAWIPIIPGWLDWPLRWGVLAFIGATALLVAWRYTFRRQAHSALNFILIYAAVDSVLSMAVYGSIIYGFL